MAMFKIVAAEQLRLLFVLLLAGSIFRVLAANTANACGADLYVRVVRAHHFLMLTVFVGAMLLQLVRMAVNSAEAASIAVARAGAAAAVEGVGCITANWRRMSVRALLLVAVVFSIAATFLAVVTIQDGFLYVSGGCDAGHAGYGMGTPVGVALMVVMTLVHGRAVRVAVCDN